MSLFRFTCLTLTEKQSLTTSNRVFMYGKIQRTRNTLGINNAKRSVMDNKAEYQPGPYNPSVTMPLTYTCDNPVEFLIKLC